MAKELTIVKTDNDGYIVKAVDPEQMKQTLTTYPNFGAVVKETRTFFDEVIVKGKKDDTEPTAE